MTHVSRPNANGVLESAQEVVARHGRSYAAVNMAFCEDGLFRMSVSLMTSHVGFSGPVSDETPGFAIQQAAWAAGLDELLRRWPKVWATEPRSVHAELEDLRSQIERQVQQPSFL